MTNALKSDNKKVITFKALMNNRYKFTDIKSKYLYLKHKQIF